MQTSDPIALTQELIALPSESSNPTRTPAVAPEAAMVDFLCRLAAAHGINCRREPVTGARENFVAEFPGRAGAPRLLLTAHLDTVSAAGMDAPFAAALRNEKIHGRGACDDKGPLATALAALLELRTRGRELAYQVTLAGTVDEECSMSGAAALAAAGPWDLVIALEPTSLRMITAHKGVYRCEITTKGRAAHSSAPEQGKNAIMAMCGVINDLTTLEYRLRRRHHPTLGRATLAVTRIEGGTSVNIIPESCRAAVDIRLLPDHDPDGMARTVANLVGWRGTVETTFMAGAMATSEDEPLVKAFAATLAAHGHEAEAATAAYATDCSRLHHQGPCLVWGPGDIAQAHQRDEYISVEQLRAAQAVLMDFLTP